MPNQPAVLLQGTLDLIVLQLLRAEPTNGYDLALRIQAVSRDVLQVNAGSLYPALYRLEERGLIKAEWRDTPKGRRAQRLRCCRAGSAVNGGWGSVSFVIGMVGSFPSW